MYIVNFYKVTRGGKNIRVISSENASAQSYLNLQWAHFGHQENIP